MESLYQSLLSQINNEYIDEFNKRFDIFKDKLKIIYKEIDAIDIKNKDVIWSGGSFLFLIGITDEFNDIDINIIINNYAESFRIYKLFRTKYHNIYDDSYNGYDCISVFNIKKKIQFILVSEKSFTYDIDLCKCSISLIDYKISLSHCICGPNLTQNHIIKPNILNINNYNFNSYSDKSLFNFEIYIRYQYNYKERYIKYFLRLLSSIINKKSALLKNKLNNKDFDSLNNLISTQKLFLDEYLKLKNISSRRNRLMISCMNKIKYYQEELVKFISEHLSFMFNKEDMYKTIFCFLKQDYCMKNYIDQKITRYCFNDWYYKTFCKIGSKYLKKKLLIESDICLYCTDEKFCDICIMEFLNKNMTKLFFKIISSMRSKNQYVDIHKKKFVYYS